MLTTDRMVELKTEGKSYQRIGALAGISRQRVHQLISGYKCPAKQNRETQLIYAAVLERDNYKCQNCGAMTDLVVHHQDGDDRNNRDSNLVCLCNPCHLALHRPAGRPKPNKIGKHQLVRERRPITEFTISTDDLMSVQDAARELGRPRLAIYRMIERGTIVGIKLGGTLYILVSEVERLKSRAEK